MSDVTAYTMTVKCMNYCYGGSPALEVDEYPDEFCVVKYADHLAALERVRVETLRELDKQLATAMELLDGDPAVIGLRKARRAIDRLINAATTGDTDD